MTDCNVDSDITDANVVPNGCIDESRATAPLSHCRLGLWTGEQWDRAAIARDSSIQPFGTTLAYVMPPAALQYVIQYHISVCNATSRIAVRHPVQH